MSKLRLGPVVDEKPTKLTIEVSGALLRDLSDYGRVHAKANGLADPLSPEKMIGPMIERFMAGDREFAKLRRRQ